MNLVIDFTQNAQYSVSQLENMEDINEITFVVPIFIFLQNNFRLLYNYVQFLNSRPLIQTNIKPVVSQEQSKQLQQHSVVLVRGTFDHFHLGHQVMLLKAIYTTSHKLLIQIKDDSILTNKNLIELIQPLDIRRENVKKFVENIKPQIQIQIEVINQVYGSSPYTKGIDAVVVGKDSLYSLKHINKLRKNNGLKKVNLVISPLITVLHPNETLKQKLQLKISSRKTRQYILKTNNFTLNEYIEYRQMWDQLIKEIYTLCRIKGIDFVTVQRWWQRILYKHSKSVTFSLDLNKKKRASQIKSNRQVYMQMILHNNQSTPNQQSLQQISINMALLFQGVEQQQKNTQGVVRNFIQSLLKKKGKSKTCKKIRKMITNKVKQYIQLQKGKLGSAGAGEQTKEHTETRTIKNEQQINDLVKKIQSVRVNAGKEGEMHDDATRSSGEVQEQEQEQQQVQQEQPEQQYQQEQQQPSIQIQKEL